MKNILKETLGFLRETFPRELSEFPRSEVQVFNDFTRVHLGNATTNGRGYEDIIDIMPDGNVWAATDRAVEYYETGHVSGKNPKDTSIKIDKDFTKVSVNGVTIQQAEDGHLIISAPGKVEVKPQVFRFK